MPTVPAGAELHLSAHGGDGDIGGVVLFEVDDVNRLFAEFTARGVAIQLPPKDWTRGQREFTVRDPERNSLRFCSPLRDRPPGEPRSPGTRSQGLRVPEAPAYLPRWQVRRVGHPAPASMAVPFPASPS
ncbi:MAG: hypothetical protein IPK67_11690 [Planctomycetes bacterium]|nr:hypothetical protein [Planctomycetota bacterium]